MKRKESSKTVELEQMDDVAVLRFSRHPANAIDITFVRDLTGLLAGLEHSRNTRGVVLTGSGNFFSAGLDLKRITSLNVEDQRAMLVSFSELVRKAYAFTKPVVAAINGHAVAGGLLLALTCDCRVGSTSPCQYGLTGVKVGIPYPVSAMQLIKAQLPPATARNMLLMGIKFGPEEALDRGILDELAEPQDVLARSTEVARELAQHPRDGFARIKEQFRERTLLEMKRSISEGTDPLLESWLTRDSAPASARALESEH